MGKAERKKGTYDQLKQQCSFLEDAEDSDLVIAVMGRTGAGKSTFINVLCGEDVAVVGHTLKSTTSTVQHHVFSHPHHAERRILVVDTPGFDDTSVPEAEILKRIAVWLANSYEAEMKLAGLVYMFDINTRFGASEKKSYNIFQALCGLDGASKVVLATSKWDKLDDVKNGEICEKELVDEFWQDMYAKGSTIHRLGRSREWTGESAKEPEQASAQKVIETILSHGFTGHLDIQRELVDEGRALDDTRAGKVVAGKEERKSLKKRVSEAIPSWLRRPK